MEKMTKTMQGLNNRNICETTMIRQKFFSNSKLLKWRTVTMFR